MWFESKHNIRRTTESYPRVKKDTKISNNDLYKQYNGVKEEIHQFLDKLNDTASIPYAKLNKYMFAMIQELLEALNFEVWVKVLTIKHKFEFLVRFITNLRIYHDITLGKDENKNNRERIQAFRFPSIMEERLIKLNHLRNKICHELYDLTYEDKIRIEMGYFQWLIFLLEKEFKPIIDSIKKMTSITQEDCSNLLTEIQFYIYKCFVEEFPDNQKYNEEISAVLNEVF